MPGDRNPYGDVKSGSTAQRPKRTGAIIAIVVIVVVVIAAILIVPRFMGGSATTTAPTEQTQAVSQDASQLVAPIEVVLVVDSDEHGDGVLFDGTLTVEDGSTVEELLDASGLQVSKGSTLGSSAYISGINGIMEKEQRGTSGWIYYVNGEKASRSCDQVTLKEGDQVMWCWKLDGTTID